MCPCHGLGSLCCDPHWLWDPSMPPLPSQTPQMLCWGRLLGSRARSCPHIAVSARRPGSGHADGLQLISHPDTAPLPLAKHCHHPTV